MFEGPLLAKRPVDGKRVTLLEHSRTVLDCVGFVFGEQGRPTRLSQQWLRFFKLPEKTFPNFLRNLRISAIFHDIGKANDGFQLEVLRKGKQMIRHEHLSALLLLRDPIGQWLRNHTGDGVDTDLVLSAVVSHHLKVSHETFASQLQPADAPRFVVYSDAPEFVETVKLAAAELNDSAPETITYAGPWRFDQQVAPLEKEFKKIMRSFAVSLRGDEERLRLLLAVRAGLIVADSAGSAISRMGLPLKEWIGRSFGNSHLTAKDIENKVIVPRIEELQREGKWTGFHDFQKAAANLGPRALLLSGCGTGKTLAAWKWIQAQLDRRPASRVLFLYPTRATSTEGFRDYVSWAGEADAALLHGTAGYDLEGMFENPGDPRSGGDYTVPERLFAISYWRKRIFSATVDSFLAMMANRYGPICLLPLLADSVVVFDEVHSFDRSMFTALERFLKFFDVPVLCMTASLPGDRLEVLRDGCGLEIFPKDPSGFADLRKQSKAPRYLVRKTSRAKIRFILETAVRDRKKVLWVLNTVRRCQAAVQSLSSVAPDSRILCYHSRFKLEDRKKRHNEVIRQFREQTGPLVAVTTQVCEMSLDLDADVLMTEVAPVPSLIQRMGRCCREPIPRDGRVGLVYAYYPEDERPYDNKKEVEQGLRFVEQMAKRKTVSHGDLAEYLQGLDVIDPFIEEGFAPFLDSRWYAEAREGEFREGDEFCVDGVLDCDVERYLNLKKNRDPATEGLILPVPRKHASENPRLGRYIRQAPGSHYHPKYGLLDEEVRNGR